MRVGRPAANLYNLRVQSAARSAAQLITASRDPSETLGLFLGALADQLVPPTSSNTTLRQVPPQGAVRSQPPRPSRKT
jgi:hypothetical protein